MTVEGSPVLAKLASDSLQQISPAGTVVNALFDDAIDQDVPRLKNPIDFAFIDGHHERIATIHYYERLIQYLAQPAIVVFDDIAWSADMNEAWNVPKGIRTYPLAGSIDASIYLVSNPCCG